MVANESVAGSLWNELGISGARILKLQRTHDELLARYGMVEGDEAQRICRLIFELVNTLQEEEALYHRLHAIYDKAIRDPHSVAREQEREKAFSSCHRLCRLAMLILPRDVYEHSFCEQFADFELEYDEALKESKWNARKVVIRGYVAFVRSLCLYFALRTIDSLSRLFR